MFVHNGKPVKAIGVTGDYMRASRSTWPNTVILQPWGNGALRLALPETELP